MGNLTFILELFGTVAFAISGAMIAIERKLDLFGVLFLGATPPSAAALSGICCWGRFPPVLF